MVVVEAEIIAGAAAQLLLVTLGIVGVKDELLIVI